MSVSTTNANINAVGADGVTALHRAAEEGNVKEVERLIASGANVDAQTVYDRTPLHHASTNGHLHVVQALLKRGADIDAQDDDGWSCLYVAARGRHFDVVEFLLYQGANADVADDRRRTPLHFAAERDDGVPICELLIAFGADVEYASSGGFTAVMRPVMRPVLSTSFHALRLLLDLNADTTKSNRWGWTISQTDNNEVKQLLLEHSKKSESERQQTRLETLGRIRSKVGIRLMRYAHPDIVNICLALAPLYLPPYVLLWTMDWLPQFARLSHHKKIALIESVVKSIRRIKHREEEI